MLRSHNSNLQSHADTILFTENIIQGYCMANLISIIKIAKSANCVSEKMENKMYNNGKQAVQRFCLEESRNL